MRARNMYILGGGFLLIVLMLIADPDTGLLQDLPFGAGAIATFIILFKSVLYVGMLHYSRKALFDYIDLEEVFKQGMKTSEGASRIGMAISLAMIAISIVIFAATS